MSLHGTTVEPALNGTLAIAFCALFAAINAACWVAAPRAPGTEPDAAYPTPRLLAPTPTPETHGPRNPSAKNVVDVRPTPTPEIHVLHDATWYASPSLEEQIYRSRVIVRASLKSVTATTETVPSQGAGVAPTYRPAHELRFTIHEYLKGSGPDEAVVVIPGRHTYLTEAEARREADRSVRVRNAGWDGRQGVLFMNPDQTPDEAGGESAAKSPVSNRFFFSRYSPLESEWDYSIDSLSRAWLPASDETAGASSEAASGSVTFITDGTKSPSPTVSLAKLKAGIAGMAATLKAGEGIEGYEKCVRSKIRRDRYYRGYTALSGRSWTPIEFEKTLASGSAAGTDVFRDKDTDGEPQYIRYWVSGPDKDYFQSPNVDDDTNPSNGYYYTLSTTRPLPAGSYTVRHNMQHYTDIPCNFVPDDAYLLFEVTVTAATGTVHEAFFDPVAIGSDAGADGSNGVLKPNAFGHNSATTTIGSIRWGSQQVTVASSPAALPANHHVDFISLDGTVALRLDVDDATQTTSGSTRTLTWGVCSRPWSAGDKLMLRLSLSPANLTGATNNASCAAPSATSTP